MEQRRTLLIIALMFLGFLLWNAWEKEFAPPPVATTAASSTQGATTSSSSDTTPVASSSTPAATGLAKQQGPIPTTRQIQVKTDLLNVAIDTQGGDIIQVALPAFPLSEQAPKEPYVLLNDDPNTQYTAPSHLIGTLGTQVLKGPMQYQVQQSSYTLANGQDGLDVALTWQSPEGLTITKTFQFTRGSYVIGVKYTVDNKSNQTWTGHYVAELNRIPVEPPKSMFVMASSMYAAYSTQNEAYEKLKFSALDKTNLSQNTDAGWVAMTQRYFLSAWIPDPKQTNHLYTQSNGNNLYTIGFAGPQLTAAPNQTVTTNAHFYAGPEDTETLKAVAPNLDLTLDYGWLWFISSGLFWLMSAFYKFVGNWGWAIVLTTIMIKIIFYPLTAKSFRSMAQMRNLAPKLAALKERFGDDRQKMSQATMELYRKEKVNPLSGCLPMLIQIPVFIALYWVLIDSVQLRQAPFIFWIHDLSAKDPYYILPVLMGISMYIQTYFNPPSPDPTQAKVMKFLPVIFTFFFLHFPSGLVLYWIVNNVTQILQQWYVMKKFNKKAEEVKALTHKNNNKKKK